MTLEDIYYISRIIAAVGWATPHGELSAINRMAANGRQLV